MNREDLIETIGNMTIIELAELVKELEDKFGVSALTPVVVNNSTPEPIDIEPLEEQTIFDVYLTYIGDRKIQVIKAVRELTDLGLREAKAVVDATPSKVIEGVSKEIAEAAVERLESIGALGRVM